MHLSFIGLLCSRFMAHCSSDYSSTSFTIFCCPFHFWALRWWCRITQHNMQSLSNTICFVLLSSFSDFLPQEFILSTCLNHQSTLNQTRSQDFTLGPQKLRGCILFSQKSRRSFLVVVLNTWAPSSSSTYLRSTEHFRERTMLLYWIKHALRPNKTVFRKNIHSSGDWRACPPPPGYASALNFELWTLTYWCRPVQVWTWRRFIRMTS